MASAIGNRRILPEHVLMTCPDRKESERKIPWLTRDNAYRWTQLIARKMDMPGIVLMVELIRIKTCCDLFVNASTIDELYPNWVIPSSSFSLDVLNDVFHRFDSPCWVFNKEKSYAYARNTSAFINTLLSRPELIFRSEMIGGKEKKIVAFSSFKICPLGKQKRNEDVKGWHDVDTQAFWWDKLDAFGDTILLIWVLLHG